MFLVWSLIACIELQFQIFPFEAEHLYLQHIDTCQHFWSKHQQQWTILSVHHNHVTIKIISILQIKIKTTTVNFDCSKANTETWEFHMPFVLCPKNLEMESNIYILNCVIPLSEVKSARPISGPSCKSKSHCSRACFYHLLFTITGGNSYFKLWKIHIDVPGVNFPLYFFWGTVKQLHSFLKLPVSYNSCTLKLIRVTERQKNEGRNIIICGVPTESQYISWIST